jgi:hypothetical protein
MGWVCPGGRATCDGPDVSPDDTIDGRPVRQCDPCWRQAETPPVDPALRAAWDREDAERTKDRA